MDEVARVLFAWSHRHRLAERALAEFAAWLAWDGGAVGDFGRADIRAEVWEQALVFRRGPHPGPPRVVTRLALSVFDGDCPLGTYDLVTDLNGVGVEEAVELGAEVALDDLGVG